MTIIIDSSIWVSALHFVGRPEDAMRLALQQDQVTICDTIAAEVVRTLTDKFGWNHSHLDQVLKVCWKEVRFVPISGALRGVCRDPNDDMVLECAVNSAAEVILTGDLDLLALHSYLDIRVMSVRE